MPITVMALLLAGSGLMCAAPPAMACSCVGPRGAAILGSNASVFTGKAIRTEYLEPDRTGWHGAPRTAPRGRLPTADLPAVTEAGDVVYCNAMASRAEAARDR